MHVRCTNVVRSSIACMLDKFISAQSPSLSSYLYSYAMPSLMWVVWDIREFVRSQNENETGLTLFFYPFFHFPFVWPTINTFPSCFDAPFLFMCVCAIATLSQKHLNRFRCSLTSSFRTIYRKISQQLFFFSCLRLKHTINITTAQQNSTHLLTGFSKWLLCLHVRRNRAHYHT